MQFKANKLSAFDVQFQTNVWLPEYIGLGKGAALGFGMVGKGRAIQTTKKRQ
jgi:CRISPR/Cas system endoribonuclease Cas6 (RAMP superfamily)